jgi:hypothetical protein
MIPALLPLSILDVQGTITSLGLELKDALKDLPCHAAAVYGENTHLADDTLLSSMAGITNGEVPVFTVPGSSHYPMIDSPLALVSAIKGVGLTWVAIARRSCRRGSVQRCARPSGP